MHPHAFVVVDGEGHGVLTHLGIDTVQLNGQGFELLVNKGDTVTRGQAVVRWNPADVEAAGKSPICPVVALEATADSLSDVVEDGDVVEATSSSAGAEPVRPRDDRGFDIQRDGGCRRSIGDG